jgi:hypothetical protein
MLALLATFLLATPAQLELGAHSRLFIDGDSNVRRWSCDSGEVQLAATVETGSDRQPPSVHSLIIEVAVGSLRCGDPHMEDNLRESLKADRFPVIRYRFGDARAVHGVPAGHHLLVAKGTLTVAGITRGVDLVVRATATPEGDLRAVGSLPLRMSDFGIEPPSAFFGIVQSKDDIVVRFDFRGRAVPIKHPTATGGSHAGSSRTRFRSRNPGAALVRSRIPGGGEPGLEHAPLDVHHDGGAVQVVARGVPDLHRRARRP